MYEETGFFDPNSMIEATDAAMALNVENFDPNAHLIQEPNQVLPYNQSNWDTQERNGHQEPDLLNLLHLPSCTNSSFINPSHTTPLGFTGDLPSSSDPVPPVLYDPLFHPNLPPQPPFFGALYEDGNGSCFNNGVLEFNGEIDMACFGKRGKAGKAKKPIISERQRRVEMNDKFSFLKSLVPNSNTKTDKASVVGDACEYIKELQRTVNELKLLVEKKQFARDQRSTRHNEGCDTKPSVDPIVSLRSSWLQRKSKDTEVDVRIIDNEVTIKLVQRKKIDCLLVVSKVLDELQLDLHHVAGGHIGDYSSFLLNTKIYEGSCVYAGFIAKKILEVMDKHYAAVPQTNNFSY